MPAFLYGWSLLLVIQSGGMAAVAITFARYFLELTHLPVPDGAVAAAALALLTAINCLGVRAGSNVQSVLMVLKILAIVALVLCGLLLAGADAGAAPRRRRAAARPDRRDRRGADPGHVRLWRLADGELRRRRDARSAPRSRPRRCCSASPAWSCSTPRSPSPASTCSGPTAWPATRTPATAVMRLALGDTGATLIALGIAISALGFLSQGMLTAPRVYFAMAEDRLFFRQRRRGQRDDPRAGRRDPAPGRARRSRSRCPAAYGQILSYVVSVDFIWFGLTGAALFVFRRRDAARARLRARPAIPVTTGLFVARLRGDRRRPRSANSPVNSAIGFAILLAGVPAFLYWRRAAMTRAGDAIRLYALGQDPGAGALQSRLERSAAFPAWTAWPIAIADARARWRQPLPLPAAARGDRAPNAASTPDRVVMADGTSMANMLAMAALIAPGDEVLAEHPAYEPMVAAARFLGAEVRQFTPRRARISRSIRTRSRRR